MTRWGFILRGTYALCFQTSMKVYIFSLTETNEMLCKCVPEASGESQGSWVNELMFPSILCLRAPLLTSRGPDLGISDLSEWIIESSLVF